ncbi:hypothetical protein GCM10023258_28170 [Terrabacter aeriphilus]|uniref:Signal peptidase I n=1 Tax=Terrabacter aeriphilus TaxID=515662 RepID=A0ABP9JFT3_9MICO
MRTATATTPQLDQPVARRDVVGGRARRNPAARVLRFGWLLVTRLLLVVAGLSFLVVALGPHLLGYRTATMLTGSMSPGINPGDVIVSTPKPAADVKVGDVISYHIPVEDHRVETHRIVRVTTDAAGRLAIVTKGDANAKADPWVATLEGDTVWQTRAVIPHAGTVIRALREPFVQTYVFWGALALLLVVALRRIWSPVPVLDDEALEELVEELGSADAAHAFARTYTELIGARVERIEHAVLRDDVQAAVEAGLSLEVTSTTVGAARVAARTHAVTEAMEAGRPRRARRALRALRRATAPTAQALRHAACDGPAGPAEAMRVADGRTVAAAHRRVGV